MAGLVPAAHAVRRREQVQGFYELYQTPMITTRCALNGLNPVTIFAA